MRYAIILVGMALLAGCGIGDAQTRVRSAVDARSPDLNQCYAAALTRDASTSGTMSAWVYVESNEGRVERVEFEPGEVSDPTLQSCMNEALTQIRLDEPPAANLKIQYSFQLTPAG